MAVLLTWGICPSCMGGYVCKVLLKITVGWVVGQCVMTLLLWHQVILHIFPSGLGIFRWPVPCHHKNSPCVLNLHSRGNLHISSYNFPFDYLRDTSSRVVVILGYFSGTLPLFSPSSSSWHVPLPLWWTWNWGSSRHICMTISNGHLFMLVVASPPCCSTTSCCTCALLALAKAPLQAGFFLQCLN